MRPQYIASAVAGSCALLYIYFRIRKPVRSIKAQTSNDENKKKSSNDNCVQSPTSESDSNSQVIKEHNHLPHIAPDEIVKDREINQTLGNTNQPLENVPDISKLQEEKCNGISIEKLNCQKEMVDNEIKADEIEDVTVDDKNNLNSISSSADNSYIIEPIVESSSNEIKENDSLPGQPDTCNSELNTVSENNNQGECITESVNDDEKSTVQVYNNVNSTNNTSKSADTLNLENSLVSDNTAVLDNSPTEKNTESNDDVEIGNTNELDLENCDKVNTDLINEEQQNLVNGNVEHSDNSSINDNDEIKPVEEQITKSVSKPVETVSEDQSPKETSQTHKYCNGNSDLENTHSDSLSQQSQESAENIEVELATVFSSTAYPQVQVPDPTIWYQFEIGQDLVGRLIGKSGCFVKKIKARTGTSIIVQRHPNKRLRLCSLQGTKSDIYYALSMIREQFPLDVYPNLSLTQVNNENALKNLQFNREQHKISLPTGVVVEVRVSNVSSTAEVWLQQPLHPSYSALPRLMDCLERNYGNIEVITPGVPEPVFEGVVCVAKVNNQWMRCQIINSQPPNCIVSLLDFGGAVIIPTEALRQIRTDYMSLPFQADQCFLAGIVPVGEYWDDEGRAALESLVQGNLISATVVAYTEDGIPCVNLYLRQYGQFSFVNQRLVELGHARWLTESTGEIS